MRISLRYEFYRGLNTRVARRLGVSRSYVWRVANGERRSPKVEAAIEKELARVQRQTEKALARNGSSRARSNSQERSC